MAFLALLILGPLALLALALDHHPLVPGRGDARFGDMESAHELAHRLNPQSMDPGTVTTVTVSQAELDAALASANSALRLARATAAIGSRGVEFAGTLTLPIPNFPFGRYVNVRGEVEPSADGLVIGDLRVGHLPIPAGLLRWVIVTGLDETLGPGHGAEALRSIKAVSVKGDTVRVAFQPPARLVEDVVAAAHRLGGIADTETIQLYYDRLAGLPSARQLTAYIGPIFTLAAERSKTRDPAAENRAALLALALYFGDPQLEKLMPGIQKTDPDTEHVHIQGRHDWVQHFLTSAGLELVGGAGISDLIGTGKEISDSNGSEGFGFTDLAADRTGVRLAEVATGSAAGARSVQRVLAGRPSEKDFFPKISDLPEEGIDAATFKARYGDTDSPAYTRMIQEIDARIAAIPLYR